jgi:glycosyltransferase involved in cell wall biosynthesis
MSKLHILFLSHHFPPEVSAGASRVFELSRAWVAAGHRVTVLTCAPNHPAGIVYPGYRNRLRQRETVSGIEVVRIWSYVAPNKAMVRRTLNYLSYLISATVAAPFLERPDIIVSSSPQFFCGLAGYPVSRLLRRPWVVEIRDLWPESIVAVGAMRPNVVTRALQVLERLVYRKSDHIVSASEAFIPHFEACGIARDKISVVTNGVDLSLFAGPTRPEEFRKKHNLEGKFVAAYLGTHGMAHKLETVLEAADRLRSRSDIVFLLAGDGAERERLQAQCRAMALPNVLMLGQLPRDEMPTVWASSDAALVLLRASPVFELVIPSKMLEAMAMRRPVILGVRGQAQRIVEGGDCGVVFEPEDAEGLARQVVGLADDPALRRRLGDNGSSLATTVYDRNVLAKRYLDLLKATARPPARAAVGGE